MKGSAKYVYATTGTFIALHINKSKSQIRRESHASTRSNLCPNVLRVLLYLYLWIVVKFSSTFIVKHTRMRLCCRRIHADIQRF